MVGATLVHFVRVEFVARSSAVAKGDCHGRCRKMSITTIKSSDLTLLHSKMVSPFLSN